GPVQRAEEPVAGALAGEHPPGAVAAVGGGRQPDDDDRCTRIAETGHGPAPVLLVCIRGALVDRHLLAPRPEPRAGAACDDLGGQLSERIRHRAKSRLAGSDAPPRQAVTALRRPVRAPRAD